MILVWLVLLTGVVLRLVIWYQNRNLTLDEANVARNLYERNFLQLCLPLSYEQYAPPLFLWIEKLLSLISGFGERSLKFYPLAAGIASLFLFRNILKYYIDDIIAWFPMAFISFTYLLIRYSAELKQYSSDVMVTLVLINLALATDILATDKKKFLIIWIVAGTLAIWSSMPSVFILAGVACYYIWICIETSIFKKLMTICIPAVLWVIQFGIYYFAILKSQAESKYLQDYHQDYFLFANIGDWRKRAHDIDLYKEIFHNAAGNGNQLFIKVHMIFACIAVVYFLLKQRRHFFLIVVPIILLSLAALLHKFTLIDRVILFCQPLWVLLIGVGFSRIFKIRLLPLKLALLSYGVHLATQPNMFWLFQRKYLFQELLPALQYVEQKGGSGNDLYIHHASVPIYLYYTQMHPDKNKLKRLFGAHLLQWDSNYWTIADTIKTDAYFAYAGVSADELAERRKDIMNVLVPAGGLDTFYCIVDHYRYELKQADKRRVDNPAK